MKGKSKKQFPTVFITTIILVICAFQLGCSNDNNSSNNDSGTSVARIWSEEILGAIRVDTPSPTVHARNLFHLSMAMYDAWAAYDNTSVGYLTKEKVSAGNVESARAEAISFAAYRILSTRYADSPGAGTSLPSFDSTMDSLGYDRSFTSTVGDSPAALGNRIAAAVLAFGLTDGSNEQNGYVDTTGYMPLNDPMIVELPGAVLEDLNHWQPLDVMDNLQVFLTPQWGFVTPFALTPRDNPAVDVYLDPGLPPQLGGVGDAIFKEAIVRVIRFSSFVDPTENVFIDISPSAIGNNPLGTDDGMGHEINPFTGQPYEPNMVNRADYGRVLAEFWADGPQSETPPGHWNSIANEVSDNPLLIKSISGIGPVVNNLEWDVKLYFTLNGGLHDAAIAAWDAKVKYDYVRPISMIRYMGGMGQSSDPEGPSFHPDGLPLVPGLIEVVTEESSGPQGEHSEFSSSIGAIVIYAWRGSPMDPETEFGGVGWILAEDWFPYQRADFVTPPFAGYISGHSTFSRAAAEVLTAFTGDMYFPGGLGTFVAEKDTSLVFELGPTEDVTLEWGTYYDAADEAGISRIWGGIHVDADDFEGRFVGSMAGMDAYNLAMQHFNGTAD